MKYDFKNQFIVDNFAKKIIWCSIAIILMGFFLSFLIEVGWGTDPYSFMNLNIANAIGWSLGNEQLTFNLVVFVFVFFFGFKYIGFGSFLNMVLIGYVVDLCRFIWRNIGLAQFIQEGGFAVHLGVFAAAIACFVFCAAIYMNCGLGLSPYDAPCKMLSDKMPRFPFFILRMLYDFIAIIIGLCAGMFSSGGIQGSLIGSCVIAVSLGPVISLVGKFLNPILFEEKR